MNYQRNYKIITYYNSISMPFMLGSIITVFLLYKKLDYTQIYMLSAAAYITVTLFEIPTGMIADKYGYKTSLIMGSLFLSSAVFIYTFFTGFYAFIVAEVILGIGMTFVSGADSALVYDSLLLEGREKEYTTIYGQTKQYSFLVAGIGTLVAPILFKIHPNLPVGINAVIMTTALVSGLFLIEPKVENQNKKKHKQSLKENIKIFKDIKLFEIVVYSSVLYIFSRTALHGYHPYFEATEIDVAFYGIIFFGFNLLAMVSSRYSGKMLKFVKSPMLLILMMTLLSYILRVTNIVYIGLFGICLQQLVRGFHNPIVTNIINRNIKSDRRATAISMVSFTNSLFASISGIGIGYIIQNNDIFKANKIISITMIVILIIAYGILKIANSEYCSEVFKPNPKEDR